MRMERRRLISSISPWGAPIGSVRNAVHDLRDGAFEIHAGRMRAGFAIRVVTAVARGVHEQLISMLAQLIVG
jgi:hypothetical protein